MEFNRQNLRASHELGWFILDFVMLGLLIINLIWLVFDSVYSIAAVQSAAQSHLPVMAEMYDPIHQDFLFYDGIFVSIFLSEFCLRWTVAVRHKTYSRWYFYPFIHWYDLIGCIPVAGARILRFLRVFSILYRLHKYQVIDLTQNRIFKFAQFYYDVLLEELADRIVVKVLSSTQEELRHGSPLVNRIQRDILLPRRDLVVSWLSERLARASRKGYLPNQAALRTYLEEVVDDAMQHNADLRRVRQVPMVGDMVSEALERAVGDIVAQVIHQILSDLASSENHAFIEDLTEAVLHESASNEQPSAVESQFLDVVIEILDLVKQQVMVKRWEDRL